jgi:hypothetical protein
MHEIIEESSDYCSAEKFCDGKVHTPLSMAVSGRRSCACQQRRAHKEKVLGKLASDQQPSQFES